MEFAPFIHVLFVRVDCQHICQDHMVGTQRYDFPHLALHVYRALLDHGSLHMHPRNRGQVHLFKLIHVTSALYTTVIGGKCQILGGKVDHKLSRLFNDGVRVSLRSDGNRYHRRIGTHGAHPGQGNNIRFAVCVSHADHNSGQGIQHIPRLPYLFCHVSFCSPFPRKLRHFAHHAFPVLNRKKQCPASTSFLRRK